MRKQIAWLALVCAVATGLFGAHSTTASAASLSTPKGKSGLKASYNKNDGQSFDNGQANDGSFDNARNGGDGQDTNADGSSAGDNQNGGDQNGGSQNGAAGQSQTGSNDIEKVIADGMKYLGTPYEFGSDRSSSKTFDCSDFTKWIFHETLGVDLPSDSRQQGDYVKQHGQAKTDWHQLKRGDLIFFMSYRGSKEADYAGVDKSSARITHVGLYLGDGKVLQTYSVKSGGVRVDSIEGTAWEYRFLFGGSVV